MGDTFFNSQIDSYIFVDNCNIYAHAMNEGEIKIKVQRRIVICSVLLLVGKFIAFFITNSVGILTDAMESIVNVTAGFVSLYSIYVASKPKDEGHPFGHGKIELISASLEGIMILAAGLMIVYEGVRRLFEPAMIDKLDIGIYIIAGAGLVNWILGTYSIRVGKKYGSIALVAGGKHLHSDVYSTIGLVLGLIILYFTKIAWIDSALALVFGSIIIYTGVHILRTTIANLMDKADPDVLQTVYNEIIQNRSDEWIDIHNMKILKYGNNYFVDCDLTLPWYFNIKEGHDSSVALATVMRSKFQDKMRLSIHTDPCLPVKDCAGCGLIECKHRENPFEERTVLTYELMVQDDDSLI